MREIVELDVEKANVIEKLGVGGGELGSAKQSIKGELVVLWIDLGKRKIYFGFGFDEVKVIGILI